MINLHTPFKWRRHYRNECIPKRRQEQETNKIMQRSLSPVPSLGISLPESNSNCSLPSRHVYLPLHHTHSPISSQTPHQAHNYTALQTKQTNEEGRIRRTYQSRRWLLRHKTPKHSVGKSSIARLTAQNLHRCAHTLSPPRYNLKGPFHSQAQDDEPEWAQHLTAIVVAIAATAKHRNRQIT